MQQAPNQSTLVSVIAWIFILLASFGLFISLFQQLMFHQFFPADEFREIYNDMGFDGMPFGPLFLLEHMALVLAGMAVYSLGLLIAAIGLLKRSNLARQLFIGLMLLAVIGNLAMLVLQQMMIGQFSELAQAETEATAVMLGMLIVMRIFAALTALAFSALFGWLAWQLSRPTVRAEFLTG